MGLTADIYDIFGFTNHVISEAAALQASITDVTMAVNHLRHCLIISLGQLSCLCGIT